MADADIAVVRRFARTSTARLGVFDEHWQGRGRPLGQSRLLFELRHGPLPLHTLRARLGLDSGYASRLVHALATDGLVAVEEDPEDARVRVVHLTHDGVTEVAVLDAISDDFASSLVADLSADRRSRLVEAMEVVSRLLDAAAVDIVDADPLGDEVRTAHRAYFAELQRRFPRGFDPGDTAAELPRYRPPSGAIVLARLDERVIGTAALCPLAPRDGADRAARPLGEIKRMWVDPDTRGLGVGRRLLEAVELRAAEAGYATLRLDTNETLDAALGLYESAGYRTIDRYNHNPYATHFLERTLSP